MAAILNIETATPLCSVALAIEGNVIARRETFEEKSHAARLTVFIEEILKEQGLQIKDLQAIAIGKGPGSYTGLRIGVSTAKGLCYGADIPLIAVGTLRIMANYAKEICSKKSISLSDENILLCPMIDARRMEVFSCLYSVSGEETESVSAKIIDDSTYAHYLQASQLYFFGSGMEKCRPLLSHPNAFFLDEIYPHAAALAVLSEEKYQKKQFENLAYFEPFYLKEFVATIPKKGLPVQ
jgi:tRNA threonylcarbamoyladenosine biosynthesis protein TsaB